MNTVPKAVREAEERAEKLRQQMYQQDTGKQDEPALDDNGDEPADTTLSDDLPPNDPPQDDLGNDDEGLSESYARLQQAHKVLQGKYNSEVPRMAAEIRELRQKLQASQQATSQAKQEAERASTELREHLETVRKEYGDDLAGAFDAMASQTQKSIQEHQQQTHESAQSRFWRRLRRAHPDFDQVNADPQFLQWLSGSDDLVHGVTRQQELNDAGADLDADTVIDIFNSFKREQQQAAQQQQQQPRKPAPKPEDQVVQPRRQARRPTQEKPKYTTDDFVRLQREIQAGKWRGREAEAKALEHEIHAALTQQQ